MAYKIYLELNTRRLILKNNEQIEHIFPVAIGKPSTPTPTGDFTILNKILNPGEYWVPDGYSLPGESMVFTVQINPI